jgi:hypothetical protein
MSVKAKQWLKDNGHITEITRGRISHKNHVLLNNAYADGERFSDWTPEKVALAVTESTDKAGKVTETVTAHRIDGYDANGNIQEIAPYRYNHTTHAAYEDTADGGKGKRRSLKEVCTTDGVSLVQCTCGAPSVVATDGRGHVAVTIYPETSKPVQGNVWDVKRK